MNLLRRDMMADKPDGARGRDDKDLHDGPDTPSQGGSSGGTIARQVGSRDEEKNARGGDPEPTNVTKSDKIQPDRKSDVQGNRVSVRVDLGGGRLMQKKKKKQ